MILVKRRTLILMTVCFALAVLGVAVAGWYIAMEARGVSPERAKFLAERLLFAGIVLALALGAYGISVAANSLRFTRSLDRLVRLSRSESFSPDSSLRELGPVGERLADILYEMNRLGEKKSLKIAGLHSLADRLVSDLDRRVIVCSAAGTVLYASRPLLAAAGLEKKACVGRPAEALFPGHGLADSIESLFRGREGEGDAGGHVTLSAVENHRGERVYAVCEFTQDARLEAVMDAIRTSQGFVQSAGKRIAEGLSGFVAGLGKKKKD